MNDLDFDVIVDALARARLSATAAVLPADWAPSDLAQACRLQQAVASRLGTVNGWKVSALTDAQQRAMRVDRPIAAPLPAPWFQPSGAEFDRAAFCHAPLIECEFAFLLGSDLPARDTPYSRSEVEAAIAALHIVLEICDTRLPADSNTLQQLADGLNNGGFVLGPAHRGWRSIDYAQHAVSLRAASTGQVLASGSGAAVLDGDPVGAVLLMANLRPTPAGGLRAGQVITTGTCTQPVAVRADGELIGDFGPLGSVHLHFKTNGAARSSQPTEDRP